MVSKASEDLPEPDSPVNTTSRSRGISRSTFLRLCSRAPRIEITRPPSRLRRGRLSNRSVMPRFRRPRRPGVFPRLIGASSPGHPPKPSRCGAVSPVCAGVDGPGPPRDVDKSVSNRGFRDTRWVGYATPDTNVNGRRKSMKGPVSRFLDVAWVLLVAAPLLVAAEVAPAQTYAVTTKPNVEYVVHEGVKLTGDFYLPKGLDKAPVIVAVHGGGWQAGSPDSLNVWAPFMARNGYAVFAVRYRLAKPGGPSYPAVVYDVKSAVQFVRAKAAD